MTKHLATATSILILLVTNNLLAQENSPPSNKLFATLKFNKLLITQQSVKNRPWPKITVYSKLKATPQQAMAIFSAYDQQKLFVLDTIESTPIKELAPDHVIVRYKSKMPWPLKDVAYTNGHILTQKSSGYQLTWYQVESESTKHLAGSMQLFSWQQETIMVYQNLAHPDSLFAKLLKPVMVNKVEKSIRAIIKYIEEKSLKDPIYVQQLVNKMEQILSGKSVYFKNKKMVRPKKTIGP
ncbi:MAG: hypothetical protein HN353_07095 [Bdellovibrionales bacterium]|jgi:hypothetical protein|nr:hypothetical protein [Bdellovibrionales bacterium]MBT3525298.1 hypothetical protein [Bdellovibrionales bacterium]MBT7767502.1 hypothetical protein [Bdellovibrionales bacterium]